MGLLLGKDFVVEDVWSDTTGHLSLDRGDFLYVLTGASAQTSSSLVLHCKDSAVLPGTLTGEGLIGETDEISEQLSLLLLLQGGEHVVEVDRGFKDMRLFSLLL